MYCSNCGKPVAAGAVSCSYCGTSVPPAAAGLYAGFWRRVAAYVVDSFVLLIPGAIAGAVLGHEGAATFVQVILWWLYKALLESGARQATVGKMAFGIKVTDLQGERISFARASGRFFGMFVSALILGIGFLLAAFTARKQALHDMMAGCVVVRAASSPEETRLGGAPMPITGGVWAIVIVLLVLPFFGGILAAIAIPAYQDYTLRAKMAEAISAAGPTRDAPADSPYVRRVNGSKRDGLIEIVLEPARFANVVPEGASIRFERTDGGAWACSGRGVPPKYLPRSCRKD